MPRVAFHYDLLPSLPCRTNAESGSDAATDAHASTGQGNVAAWPSGTAKTLACDGLDGRQGANAPITNDLIQELAAIDSEHSIQKAAKRLGVSYRFLWGEIETWEARFGQVLVTRERGRPARLSPLGAKLLWAERSVLARYAVEMEKMRTELSSAFAAACDPNADIIKVAGCFDPWLATLPDMLFGRGVIADLAFSTSRDGLLALKDGTCDLAGFNFPRGSGSQSEAARLFAPLINPKTYGVLRFSSRRQGLAVYKGNPFGIESLKDVQEKELRYASRPVGTGTQVLFDDLCIQAGVRTADILVSSTEVSHEAVALAVAQGRADVGLCVEHAAKTAGVDFVPVMVEDYYLVWRKTDVPTGFDVMREVLMSPEWRATAARFAGMESNGCGEVVDVGAFGWWSKEDGDVRENA